MIPKPTLFDLCNLYLELLRVYFKDGAVWLNLKSSEKCERISSKSVNLVKFEPTL